MDFFVEGTCGFYYRFRFFRIIGYFVFKFKQISFEFMYEIFLYSAD